MTPGIERLTDESNKDGWLQEGSLLYRLTDERHPRNRDEINVTMADGSRSVESRSRRASELLDRIRQTAAQPASSEAADLRKQIERVREALPEFRQQDDYLLAHGAPLVSEDCHEIIHIDTVERIVEAVARPQPDAHKLAPVDGDVLPPIGSRVYIRHGRDDDAHACTVVGYYAWPDLGGNSRLHRVFLRLVYEGTERANARLLSECWPTAEAALAAAPKALAQRGRKLAKLEAKNA